MDPAVTGISVALGLLGIVNTVIQAVRAAPRFFKYWWVRRFFRFRNGQRVLVVCSELEDAEHRQWVEPNEFIYMLKYGDLDALFGLVWLLREVYPRCRLEVLSCREALSSTVDLECDLILIGGPDYNELCGWLMAEVNAQASYIELACDSGESSIALQASESNTWMGSHEREDFGYVEVTENPFARQRRVFFFGGCHTIGVTGATKLFKLKNELSGGLTELARENVKRLVKFGLFRRRLLVVFRVVLLGSTIPEPDLRNAKFYGPSRSILGLSLGSLGSFWQWLKVKFSLVRGASA